MKLWQYTSLVVDLRNKNLNYTASECIIDNFKRKESMCFCFYKHIKDSYDSLYNCSCL